MNEETIREKLEKLKDFAEQLGFDVGRIRCRVTSDSYYIIGSVVPHVKVYWEAEIVLTAPFDYPRPNQTDASGDNSV